MSEPVHLKAEPKVTAALIPLGQPRLRLTSPTTLGNTRYCRLATPLTRGWGEVRQRNRAHREAAAVVRKVQEAAHVGGGIEAKVERARPLPSEDALRPVHGDGRVEDVGLGEGHGGCKDKQHSETAHA